MISETAVLTDCLESMAHSVNMYMEAAFEADNDHVRDALQTIATARFDQYASVFNLMHQMEILPTAPASHDHIEAVIATFQPFLDDMASRHREADG